jgi:hypothetical protein
MAQWQFSFRTLIAVVTLAGLLFGGIAWFGGLPDGPLRDWASAGLVYLVLSLPFVLADLLLVCWIARHRLGRPKQTRQNNSNVA